MIKNTIKFLDKISRYNYINKIKKVFKDLDILTKKIIKIGLSFCLYLACFSLIILALYCLCFTHPILFSIGFILFKLSLTFGVEFIICGFVVDKIKAGVI